MDIQAQCAIAGMRVQIATKFNYSIIAVEKMLKNIIIIISNKRQHCDEDHPYSAPHQFCAGTIVLKKFVKTPAFTLDQK